MSYTYDNGAFHQEHSQFFAQDLTQSGISSGQVLTSENLLLQSKEECDLLENQIFMQGSFTEIPAVGGPNTVKSEHGPDPLKQSNSIGSSSERSSPSSTMFTGGYAFNSEAAKTNIAFDDKNQGLTDEEIAAKRKAQNRAAQRAFRERKEMKLKELEDKLNRSETDKEELKKQLDALKKQNIVITTENKLLSQKSPQGTTPPSLNQVSTEGEFTFPAQDRFHSIVSQSTCQLKNAEIPYDQKRLTIMETWEYLSTLEQEVDVQKVIKRLSGTEVCHKAGPSYLLRVIDKCVAEEWAASGF